MNYEDDVKEDNNSNNNSSLNDGNNDYDGTGISDDNFDDG